MDPVSLPDQDNTLYRKIQTFLKIMWLILSIPDGFP